MPAVEQQVLEQAFFNARTFNKFRPEPVSDETLRRLYDLLKWGPTAMNSQPGRFLFLRSVEAKQRLKPALSPNNAEKTMAAPVVVVVASDSRFYDQLPEQFPAYNAKPMFESNPAMAEGTERRNGTLQGAYLIVAARLLGLDCGPMSGFDNAKVDAEFFAGTNWRSNFLVNLGYGDPSGNHPRGPRLPFEHSVRVL